MSTPSRCGESVRGLIIGGTASPTPCVGRPYPLAVSCSCGPSRLLTWSSKTTTTRIVPLTLTRGLAHRPGLAAFPGRKMRSGWIRRSRSRGRSRKASLRIFEVLMDEVVGGGTGRC